VAAPAQISTQAILFKFGKTDFEGEQSYDQLKELGKALMDPRLKDASIQIEGHTDNVGPADFNQKLSEARAKKIVDELRQHYDLVVKELLPVGKGKLEPAAGSVDQQTDAERAQNRRVVISGWSRAPRSLLLLQPLLVMDRLNEGRIVQGHVSYLHGCVVEPRGRNCTSVLENSSDLVSTLWPSGSEVTCSAAVFWTISQRFLPL